MTGKERETSMTESGIMPRLPTSGQIIGAIVTRLGIKHDVLQTRTARRYFAGDPEHLVKDTTRREIIEAIAEALTDAGFVSPPQAGEKNCEPPPTLSAVLQMHADNWDMMRSFLRRRTVTVQPSNMPKVWEAYVRLAAIDLALRAAAHLHLAGKSPSALEILKWANAEARGQFLNQKRQQASLTLEGLAKALKVTDNTVDAWMYHNARPSNDHLTKLAETLAQHTEDTGIASISLELRTLYWVSDIFSLLAEHIGAAASEEAAVRLHKYAEEAYHIIAGRFPPQDRTEAITALANWGAHAGVAKTLLSALIENEPDEEWREDLRSTGPHWINRVISANISAHLVEVDDLIQDTEGRLLENWDVGNPAAYDHYRRSLELQAQGKIYEALAEVETAARLDPLDPANHFTLGSVKTGIGMQRGNMDLVNEGLEALWLAVALDPKWILPWTQIGSTLCYTGRPVEAIAHLRRVKPDCGPLDHHYFCTLGTACWALGDLPSALAAFDAALELDPEETSALLAASELARLTGDHKKHQRYLKQAQHFGAEEDTMNLWEMIRGFGEKDRTSTGPEEHDRKIAIMDAVIRLNPEDNDAYIARGVAHFAKGNDDLAMADMNTVLELDKDNTAAYTIRSTLYGYSRQWYRMAADMTELIRLQPDDARAYYQRGQAYGELDLLDEAFADLCQAIRLDPDHADALRVRADCLRYQGKYGEAISDFNTALGLNPQNAAAYLGRGAAYRMKGDLPNAIADYGQAALLKPEDPLAYRFRGDAHVANGDYGLAIADCNMALQLSPNDAVAHFTRGNAHLLSGQPQKALADFKSAVASDPASGRYVYARGLAHHLLGNEDLAKKDYQRAVELGYDVQDPDSEA